MLMNRDCEVKRHAALVKVGLDWRMSSLVPYCCCYYDAFLTRTVQATVRAVQ